MASPAPYARLELISEVTAADGVHGKEMVVLRPTARDMAAVLDGNRTTEILGKFVQSCCRITNGTGKLSPFALDQLDASDAAEIFSIVTAIGDEADSYDVTVGGDGINEPIVYTLRYPLRLSPDEDADVISQIQFQARKVGDISDFLDARGAEARFYAFMRNFGQMLGTNLPMSDSVIGALDALDYLVIVQHIMGKLSGARARWRKVST